MQGELVAKLLIASNSPSYLGVSFRYTCLKMIHKVSFFAANRFVLLVTKKKKISRNSLVRKAVRISCKLMIVCLPISVNSVVLQLDRINNVLIIW